MPRSGHTVQVGGLDPSLVRVPLSREDGAAFARLCVDAAGLHGRVEVSHDDRANTILISGPDQFGLMGTTAYVALSITLPASSHAIVIAIARHVLGDFYASDGEIESRAAELPLPLAVILAPVPIRSRIP